MAVDSAWGESKIGQMKQLQTVYRRHSPNGPSTFAGLVVEHAAGCRVRAADGREYLDFASGGLAPLGHSHPALAQVLAEVGHRPAVSSAIWPDTVELMAELATVVPGGTNRRVLVCDSGREALAAAVTLAQERTGRSRISYLTDQRGSEVTVGADVAALVAHPLDPRLGAAVAVCAKVGALLIDDETRIGPGLTGMMLAIESASARADLYVLGSGWTGGLPFGACVTGSSTLHWQHREVANPLGCSLALAALRSLRAGLVEQGVAAATVLERALESAQLPWPVFGTGLVWTVVLDSGRGLAEWLISDCRKHGLLLCSVGDDAVGIRPPLVATASEIEQAVGVLKLVSQALGR